ncbi:MAG: hypothetical protein IJ272_05950 [Clostridia bacterium]|jgi:hypothetical protein|nr:hypothetical protein [Clostridia bacterium]
MIQISVTRGLVQLKRLEEKIQRDIRMISEFVTVNKVQEKNVLNGTMTKKQYNEYVQTKWQSLMDKISLRQEIKDEIVKSNANTVVTIAGKKYTIAQAIEKKNNIEKFEKPISAMLNGAYAKALNSVEMKNDEVVENAEKNFFGRGEERRKNESNKDLLDAMEIYINSRKFEIIDPLNIKKLKEEFENGILDFIAEVDQVLTESNSTTMIQISKSLSDL